MLASRPVLLYTIRRQQSSQKASSETGEYQNEAIADNLSELCIQYARRSHRILIDSWILGSFPMFDPLFTQHLFSVATILSLSSLRHGADTGVDRDDFEVATQIIHQLNLNGNLVARELSKHTAALKAVIDKLGPQAPGNTLEAGLVSSDITIQPWERQSTEASRDLYNMEMSRSSLQDLLSQSDWNFDFLEPSFANDEFDAFVWPEASEMVVGSS